MKVSCGHTRLILPSPPPLDGQTISGVMLLIMNDPMQKTVPTSCPLSESRVLYFGSVHSILSSTLRLAPKRKVQQYLPWAVTPVLHELCLWDEVTEYLYSYTCTIKPASLKTYCSSLENRSFFAFEPLYF